MCKLQVLWTSTFRRHVFEHVGCTKLAMSIDLSILIVERMSHMGIM
jgi:hypothetical protein